MAPQRARLVNNAVHWSTGVGWGAAFGLLQSGIGRERTWDGVPFGAAVWLQSYAALAPAKLYKPIWDYDAKTRARISAPILSMASPPPLRSRGCANGESTRADTTGAAPVERLRSCTGS